MARKKNVGGGVWYTGKNSNVEKEAKEKEAKHGGRIAPRRLDKRARGGGVGSDKSPFTTAAKGSDMKRTTKTVPTLGRHH